MVEKLKILCVGDPSVQSGELMDVLRERCDVAHVDSSVDALREIVQSSFSGILVLSANVEEQFRVGSLLQHERILEGLPDGVVLLDNQMNIVWANECVSKWYDRLSVVGKGFYEVFQGSDPSSNELCPFETARRSDQARCTTIRCDDNRYFQVHAVPIKPHDEHSPTATLIVTIRDVTVETLQQQKLAAIHKAGIELSDLTTEEVFNMEVEDRIELLKSNILHFTKDLLNYDVVEIRLLGEENADLMPLLSIGLEASAENRPLFAQLEGNGVTGYVACTAKSYLCQDTTKDPLYLEGCKDAKSSMTVPLIQHDRVIGTFNVESPEPNAFRQGDLQFLEIFSREVAGALNTLELLVAQQANTAQASVEAIHREVALPVDEILNDAVNVMEGYIGLEQGVMQRLQRILHNARDIKQLIHKVGQELAPSEAVPQAPQAEERKLLVRRKVLVVDDDEAVRSAAHNLLERFGCIVETAHTGDEAVFMTRNVGNERGYDVIIADINLPDMSGYDLFMKLGEIITPTPLVLMKGFGYDPGHAMVKARKAGLHPQAVLYKPFRLDQLLEVCQTIVKEYGETVSS